MIQLKGMSFGWGQRYGSIVVGDGWVDSSPGQSSLGWAVVWPTGISSIDFSKIVELPHIEFIVVPMCSPYSHAAADLWFSPVPAIAVWDLGMLRRGAAVLADFDEEVLWVAESAEEEAALRSRVGGANDSAGVRQMVARNGDGSKRPISILAEVRSGQECVDALSHGADGLGVINGERLGLDGGILTPDMASLVDIVNSDDRLLPLHVRLFDRILSREAEEGSASSREYLGYRGVRGVEIDASLLSIFISRLKALEIRSAVVVLPMVTSVAEVWRIRNELGLGSSQIGITVETPAAAVMIDELLEAVTFVQIGLNDLTQYTMAWDRDVPNDERLPRRRIAAPVAALISAVAGACSRSRVKYTLGLDLRPTASLVEQIRMLGVESISCPAPLVSMWGRMSDASNLGC